MSPDGIPKEKMATTVPSDSNQKGMEVELKVKANKDIWENFIHMAAKTGSSQKDCLNLSLRLFIDYCHKTLLESKQEKIAKEKSVSSKIFRKL